MAGPSYSRFGGIFFVCLCCAGTLTIVNLPLVFTACFAVGITCSGISCMVRVVGVMATGGTCGACVP